MLSDSVRIEKHLQKKTHAIYSVEYIFVLLYFLSISIRFDKCIQNIFGKFMKAINQQMNENIGYIKNCQTAKSWIKDFMGYKNE